MNSTTNAPFTIQHRGTGTHVVSDRVFDRRPSTDARSRAFPFRAPRSLPASKTWTVGPVLNQKSVGGCVGFGWSGALAALKGQSTADRIRIARNAHALALYMLATDYDSIPGSYPSKDTGSSVLGGAKAATALGYIGAPYTWCYTAADVRLAILSTGPVVVGTTWFNSMMEAEHGYLKVDPASGIAGGHCWYVYGVSTDNVFRMRNSWGTSWGDAGGAKITSADLDVLLQDQGEACVPVLA